MNGKGRRQLNNALHIDRICGTAVPPVGHLPRRLCDAILFDVADLYNAAGPFGGITTLLALNLGGLLDIAHRRRRLNTGDEEKREGSEYANADSDTERAGRAYAEDEAAGGEGACEGVSTRRAKDYGRKPKTCGAREDGQCEGGCATRVRDDGRGVTHLARR